MGSLNPWNVAYMSVRNSTGRQRGCQQSGRPTDGTIAGGKLVEGRSPGKNAEISLGNRMLNPKLLACRLPSSQVALRFVDFEDFLHFGGQLRVDFWKSLGDIFMHGAFGYSKDFGGISYRCLAFQNIIADVHDPLPDMVLHPPAPFSPRNLLEYMAEKKEKCQSLGPGIYWSLRTTDGDSSWDWTPLCHGRSGNPRAPRAAANRCWRLRRFRRFDLVEWFGSASPWHCPDDRKPF